MGVFTKSLLILLVAVSAPLLYRQYANDNTIKFMSSYYSNYKSIDQFLRQSAGHLDQAREYLPTSSQIKKVVGQVNEHFNELITSTLQAKTSDKKSLKDQDDSKKQQSKSKANFRVAQCPSEDMKGLQLRLWSKQELSMFNGSLEGQDIYLALLGVVYDVTSSKQHYAKGAEYNVFAGRDATRAFITGNFTHDLTDDLSGLDDLYQLAQWSSHYKKSYPIVGRIEGRFFDSRGCATKEMTRVFKLFERFEQQEESTTSQEDRVNLPDCNSEWNGDLKKGRVWCSTKSGGIDRDWVGVPRIYIAGETKRCVCFNEQNSVAKSLSSHMNQYPGCDPKAEECSVME